MLAPNSTIKQYAKKSLSPNFLQSVAVCCVLVFTWFIAMFASSLGSIAFGWLGYAAMLLAIILFVLFPLFLGALYYFRRLIFEQQDSALVIFKYFSNFKEYKRALRFTLALFARFALAALFVYSPSIIIGLLSNEAIYQTFNIQLPVWVSVLWTLNSFAVIVATIGLMFITLKYYLSSFIFVSNDTIAPSEAIKFSTIISKRTGGDFFGLMLSFTPLALLSLTVAPLIFIFPYVLTAYAVHGRFAITAYNLDVDRFNTVSAPSYTADGI